MTKAVWVGAQAAVIFPVGFNLAIDFGQSERQFLPVNIETGTAVASSSFDWRLPEVTDTG